MKINLVQGSGESGYEVTQEFDLREILGVDVSKEVAEAFGQEVIDVIRERTQDNKDINGKQFAKYSDAYIKSLDFDAYGKSESDINLFLSGQMMSGIDIVEINGSKVKVGYVDDFAAVKAFAHQTGYEGHPTISGPERKFFGINKKELNTIKSKLGVSSKPNEFEVEDIKYKRNQATSMDEIIDRMTRGNIISFDIDDLFKE